MPSQKTTTPLREGITYHVFNRGINRVTLFYRPENYNFFISRCEKYLQPYFEILGYCLIQNHFHLLLRVKMRKGVDPDQISRDASEALRRLFITFVQAINKQEGRTGTLLYKPFRRVAVRNDEYLKFLLFYIHWNPMKHKVSKSFEGYKYSSFRYYATGVRRIVCIDEGFGHFNGNRTEFFEYHELMKRKMEEKDG